MDSKKIKKVVLDKGFIEVIDTLGTDLTVVNAARVSFGKRKDVWEDRDDRLVKYLIRQKHFSPFRHIQVQFHIKWPEAVARQAYRHHVGIEATSQTKDVATWNEISGRYVKVDDFYVPASWRKQSDTAKQGSEGQLDYINQQSAKMLYDECMNEILRCYETMLNKGVAKEQARLILPLSQYTEVYWTMSLQAIMNFIELRDDSHAQFEIREYAIVMKEMMMMLFPKVTAIWLGELENGT